MTDDYHDLENDFRPLPTTTTTATATAPATAPATSTSTAPPARPVRHGDGYRLAGRVLTSGDPVLLPTEGGSVRGRWLDSADGPTVVLRLAGEPGRPSPVATIPGADRLPLARADRESTP